MFPFGYLGDNFSQKKNFEKIFFSGSRLTMENREKMDRFFGLVERFVDDLRFGGFGGIIDDIKDRYSNALPTFDPDNDGYPSPDIYMPRGKNWRGIDCDSSRTKPKSSKPQKRMNER